MSNIDEVDRRPLFGWKKYTLYAVSAFVLLSVMALCSEYAKAGPYITLASTVGKADLTVSEVGFTSGKYRYGAGLTGEGYTTKGYQDSTHFVFASRVISPGWCALSGCFKMGIGIAHTPDQLQVGDTNYRLSMSYDFNVFEVFYAHISSAGTHNPNTGIDYVGLRLRL